MPPSSATGGRTAPPTRLGDSLKALDIEGFRQRGLERNRAHRREEAAQRAAEWEREREAREAFTEAGGKCWSCRDRGILAGTLSQPCPDCAQGKTVAYRQVQDRFTTAWEDAGIPPRSVGFTFATFPMAGSKALADVREWVDGWDHKRGLILTGRYGTGKTGLLVAALREIVYNFAARNQRYPVQFVTCTDLMGALKGAAAASKSGRPVGESFGTILDRAKRVRVLAIDDLGAERATAFVLETLFAIINHRYENQLPTFITTNFGLEQIGQRIGPRVWERLLETSDVLEIAGENLRLARQGARNAGH